MHQSNSIIGLIFATFIVCINAHGRLMEPVNRGSAWRIFRKPYNFPFQKSKFDTEWCAFEDPDDIRNKRNAKCGICGPIYNNDPTAITEIYKGGQKIYANVTSFEKSSPTYRGYIVKTYKRNQTIEAKVRIDANHGGYVQFRICKADGLNDDPEMSCFDNNILKFENGQTEMLLSDGKTIMEPIINWKGLPTNRKSMHYSFKVVLPENLTCKHCLFQFRWFKTRSDQLYYGCSDIEILEPSPYKHVNDFL